MLPGLRVITHVDYYTSDLCVPISCMNVMYTWAPSKKPCFATVTFATCYLSENHPTPRNPPATRYSQLPSHHAQTTQRRSQTHLALSSKHLGTCHVVLHYRFVPCGSLGQFGSVGCRADIRCSRLRRRLCLSIVGGNYACIGSVLQVALKLRCIPCNVCSGRQRAWS